MGNEKLFFFKLITYIKVYHIEKIQKMFVIISYLILKSTKLSKIAIF